MKKKPPPDTVQNLRGRKKVLAEARRRATSTGNTALVRELDARIKKIEARQKKLKDTNAAPAEKQTLAAKKKDRGGDVGKSLLDALAKL